MEVHLLCSYVYSITPQCLLLTLCYSWNRDSFYFCVLIVLWIFELTAILITDVRFWAAIAAINSYYFLLFETRGFPHILVGWLVFWVCVSAKVVDVYSWFVFEMSEVKIFSSAMLPSSLVLYRSKVRVIKTHRKPIYITCVNIIYVVLFTWILLKQVSIGYATSNNYAWL